MNTLWINKPRAINTLKVGDYFRYGMTKYQIVYIDESDQFSYKVRYLNKEPAFIRKTKAGIEYHNGFQGHYRVSCWRKKQVTELNDRKYEEMFI